MKYWKQESLMALIFTFIIPLSYWALSPFVAQLVFIPILMFGCGLILTHKYNPPLLFLGITGLTYFIFLVILSQSFDISLWFPTIGFVWGFGGVGTLIGWLLKKKQEALPIWLLVLYAVSCFILTIFTLNAYFAFEDPNQFLHFYVFIPLVCFLTQLMVGFFYPDSKWNFLVVPLFFVFINLLINEFSSSINVILYLVVAACGTWLGKTFKQKYQKS